MAELRAALADEPASVEAQQTETPVAPEGEKTAPVAEPETPPASETAPVTEPDKHGESAIDKRFRKLAQQRDEARQRAEKAERELASKTPGPAATPAAEAQPAAATSTKPAPPDPSKWTGTWEELEAAKLDYIDKLTDYKVGERERAKQTEQLLAQAKTLHTTWEAKSQTFAKDNPDFEDAIANIGPMVTRAGLADIVKESAVGPEMVLYLYQHPEEVARMGACKTQVALARELGKLEAQLSTPVTPTPTPAAKKPLPKPPASVGGGQPATVDLDKCDMRSFRREVGKLCTRD
jgi:hypothetical protein